MRLFKGNTKKQRLSLQLNKSAPGTEEWQSMLQVPSTSQNQLPDRCDDMIQFHDGKWDVDRESLCVMCFQMFTIIQLEQVYTPWAPFHKHEWGRVVDQTDPPGGNLDWNILSKAESQEEVPSVGGHNKNWWVMRGLTGQEGRKKKTALFFRRFS